MESCWPGRPPPPQSAPPAGKGSLDLGAASSSRAQASHLPTSPGGKGLREVGERPGRPRVVGRWESKAVPLPALLALRHPLGSQTAV